MTHGQLHIGPTTISVAPLKRQHFVWSFSILKLTADSQMGSTGNVILVAINQQFCPAKESWVRLKSAQSMCQKSAAMFLICILTFY